MTDAPITHPVTDDAVRAELRSAALEAVRFVRKVAKKRAEVEDAGSEHVEPSKAVYLRLQASNMLIQAWSRVAAPEKKGVLDAPLDMPREARVLALRQELREPDDELTEALKAEGLAR